MVAAYIDPALDVLRRQLWVRYPGVTIYWIGDKSHQGRPSDHNPEADGSVDAIDVMLGEHFTHRDAQNLFTVLHENTDWRLAYVIYDRHIFSSTVHPWVIRNYTGDDPHTNHIHISRNDKQESNRDRWVIESEARHVEMAKIIAKLPILKKGDRDPIEGVRAVWRLQRILGVKDDGWYGDDTEAALDRWEIPGRPNNTVNAAAWWSLYGLRDPEA